MIVSAPSPCRPATPPTMFFSKLPAAFLIVLLLLPISHCRGQQASPSKLKLPPVMSDHMVLQNGQADAVWGSAVAGTSITVAFVDPQNKTLASAQAVAGADGKWLAKLPALQTGATGEIHVKAGTEAPIVIHDVLVGEAWLCSGQSNMSYTFKAPNMNPDKFAQAQQEATDARGAIRYYGGDGRTGSWQIGTPDTIGNCSAVAWYFGVALHDKLHCPIGLIIQAVGGTPVESWMPKTALDNDPIGQAVEKRYDVVAAPFPDQAKAYRVADAAWLAANPTPELQAQNKSTRPKNPGHPPMVAWCYNCWFQWIVPYGVKGAIWFQADGNLPSAYMGQPNEYGHLIQLLIKSWRDLWQTQLPFYYVEMNNMRDVVQTQPVQYNPLCILREQQEAALELPATDVACSIDTGDKEAATNPHFPNKKPVGDRLALLALNNVYGLPCAAHSPAYSSFEAQGGKIRVHFKYADGLRIRDGGKVAGFAIRGTTGDWVWADGQIDGDDIVLSSDQVPQPVAVRYAWAANPIISIENSAGLPLRPFRTDKSSPE